MNNVIFKMKMSDGSEERCAIIAEFTNEETGKDFVLYTLEKELGMPESGVYTAIKKQTPNGEVLEQIVDPTDLAFANEMLNSLNEMAKEDEENGTSTN